MTEIKSLKNKTRILTALMFISFIVYSLGAESLAQALPFLPEAGITIIVGAATWIVTQYGTDARVVRAEDIKEQEIREELADDSETNIEEDGEDGC